MSDFPLLFSEKFKVPFVTYNANRLHARFTSRVANPSNYIPNNALGQTDDMNFIQRIHNTLLYLQRTITYYTWNLRNDEKVFRYFLGPSAPSVYDIIKNTSVIFANSHPSLIPAYPTVPAVVQVGGMHIKPTSKLPKVCLTNLKRVHVADPICHPEIVIKSMLPSYLHASFSINFKKNTEFCCG